MYFVQYACCMQWNRTVLYHRSHTFTHTHTHPQRNTRWTTMPIFECMHKFSFNSFLSLYLLCSPRWIWFYVDRDSRANKEYCRDAAPNKVVVSLDFFSSNFTMKIDDKRRYFAVLLMRYATVIQCKMVTQIQIWIPFSIVPIQTVIILRTKRASERDW